MIRFSCNGCGKNYSVDDKLGGRTAKCKACGNRMIIPDAQSGGDVIRIEPQEIRTPRTTGDTAGKTSANKLVISFNEPARQQPTPSGERRKQVQSQPARPASADSSRRGSMRIRRLTADEAAMRKIFTSFPLIRLVKTEGTPADYYQLEYRVKGLIKGNNGEPVIQDRHLVEIQLTRDYPRQSPKCKMLTPIFHPNIDPTAICVGDHWTAQERLADLVVRIGEIITYQAFNIKSPLDGEAAMWADLNRERFPVDSRDLIPPENSCG